MSDRSVVLRVRADVDQYRRDLRAAARDTQAFDRMTNQSAVSLGRLSKVAGGATLAYGIGKLLKDSVQLEAIYSRTMAQVAVATNAPKKQLAELDKLALQLGKDTVFSAQDAAASMLSLAKGGLSTAQIKAGALSDTLTLASAGGLDLASAADVVVQGMGAFQLKASQTNQAVAALAGGANASAASVSDMSQALAQVGTSANSAHLTIQDTTAFLALFANQGFKGSDAGTSLRTMLTRLVPQTKEADKAMRDLGLTYLDSNGNLVDAEEIAKRTQDAFKDLSDGQKITAVNSIFGQDAQRGVNALVAEGDEGLRKYTKATSDLTQAQKLADAANSGTSGSLEQLDGAIETAKIQIGKGLAPVVQDLAKQVGGLVEDGDFEQWAKDAGKAVSTFIDGAAPLAKSTLPALQSAARATGDVLKTVAPLVKSIVDAYNSLPQAAQTAILIGGVTAYAGDKLAGGLGSAVATATGPAQVAAPPSGKGRGAQLARGSSLVAGGALASLSTDAENANVALGVLNNTAAATAIGFGVGGPFGAAIAGSGALLYGLTDEINKHTGGVQEMYEKLAPAIDAAVEAQVEAAEQDQKSFLIKARGVEQYRSQLMSLPLKVLTEVLTPGAVQSVGDIEGLIRQFGLTPDLVKTIVETSGVDISQKQLRELLDLADRVNKKKVKADVRAVEHGAQDVLKSVLGLLDDIDGYRAKASIEIERSYKAPTKDDPNPSLSDLTQNGGRDSTPSKKKGKYTGGLIGFASGGLVPGVSPLDPTQDNVIAYNTVTRSLLKVRSGEYVVNEPQSKKNNKWLAAINAGLNIDDLFGGLDGYAEGGEFERAGSSLDLLQLRIRVRDLERSLKAREVVGKGKAKHSRWVLRGLDRTEARLELDEAREEYTAMRRANRRAKAAGLSATSYNEMKEAKAQAAADLKSARADAASSFRDNVSLDGLQTPAQVERYLAKQLADLATFTTLLIDLKKKGASPWLLDQLQQMGPSTGTIRLARQYTTDSKALASVNAQAAQLSGVAGIYGQVTASKQWSSSRSWNPGLSASQTRTLQVNATTVDPSAIAQEVTRLVVHELQGQAQGAGI